MLCVNHDPVVHYVSLEPNGDDRPFKREWKMFRIAFRVSSF